MSDMSTFILLGSSFLAEEGHNDDLMMCCVLFGWLSSQTYFKELTDSDIRARLYAENQNQLEQDMAPFGFFDDGIDDPFEPKGEIDEYGTRWSPVIRKHDSNW